MVCDACEETGRLILHHLDGNKRNYNWNNLVNLCQRCSLRLQALAPPALTRKGAIKRLQARIELDNYKATFN